MNHVENRENNVMKSIVVGLVIGFLGLLITWLVLSIVKNANRQMAADVSEVPETAGELLLLADGQTDQATEQNSKKNVFNFGLINLSS